MAINKIEASYAHICDGCKTTVNTSSQTRPTYWSQLTVARDAYDFQGYACADATIKRDLCNRCTELVIECINKAFEKWA